MSSASGASQPREDENASSKKKGKKAAPAAKEAKKRRTDKNVPPPADEDDTSPARRPSPLPLDASLLPSSERMKEALAALNKPNFDEPPNTLSSTAPSVPSSQATQHATPPPAPPAAAPGAPAAALSTPSSQASSQPALAHGATQVSQHSQASASSVLSNLSQLTPPPPPSVHPPSSSQIATPVYNDGAASQATPMSPVQSDKTNAPKPAPAAEHSVSHDHQHKEHSDAQASQASEKVVAQSPLPRPASKAKPKENEWPEWQHGMPRYPGFLEKVDKRKKAVFAPDIEYKLELAFRRGRRKVHLQMQITLDQVLGWTEGVFKQAFPEPTKQQQDNYNKWCNTHYSADSVHRTRLLRKVLHHFNKACTNPPPRKEHLTEEKLNCWTCCTLLEPGDEEVHEVEREFVRGLWERWCSPLPRNRDWILHNLKMHYSQEDNKRKGRRAVKSALPEEDDSNDGNTADGDGKESKVVQEVMQSPNRSFDLTD